MKTPLMTNLRRRSGWLHVPCVNMLSTDSKPSRHVMIDDGDRMDAKILAGDAEAIARAMGAMAMLRERLPKAIVGWYGWPYPIAPSEVASHAARLRPFMDLADIAFPCCYATGDGDSEDRAEASRDCLASVWDGKRPIVAVVSDSFVWPAMVDGTLRTMCNESEMEEQCRAARVLDADSIYVWSGLPYRVWLMDIWRKFPETCNDQHEHREIFDAVRRGRDELLNLYGFTGPDLESARRVDAAASRHEADVLGKFKAIWQGVKR